MRTIALSVAVLVAMSSTAVRADEPVVSAPVVTSSRGGLTAFGLVLFGLGLGALGLGVGGLLSAGDATTALSVYAPNGVPAQADASFVSQLNSRAQSGSTLGAVGLISGAALLVGGIICLVVDAPKAPAIAFVPTVGGGVLSTSFSF